MAEYGYLLDTSTISVMRCKHKPLHQAAVEWLNGIDDKDRICISVITLSEIKFGLELAKPQVLPLNRKKEIQEFVDSYSVLGVDKNTSKLYGEIRSDLFKKYAGRDSKNKVRTGSVENLRELTSERELGIQENDLWIVSVAIQHNMRFVTADSKGSMKKIVEIAKYEEQTTFLKNEEQEGTLPK